MGSSITKMAASGPSLGMLAARELVMEIAKERGYLGEEELGQIGAINADLRRKVEEALLQKDLMLGSAIMT
jgi:hypothetical protein